VSDALHYTIESRPALEDPAHLAALRDEVFETSGEERGAAVLYALGFTEGLVDGLRVAQGFAADDPRPRLAGPGLPLLFVPDCETGEPHTDALSGALSGSLEARIHSAQGRPAPEPSCYLSAGYAAGWYSEILRQPLLVREIECIAHGGACCRFVARTVEDWQRDGDPWIAELLPMLDLSALREAAAHRVAELPDGAEILAPGDEAEIEGDMFGGFDPMSPAVHVWGPVMILPYSGPADGEAALEMVASDLDSERIEIAVVDVTGVRMEAVAAAGLARFLDHLEALQVETVVVGLGREAWPLFQDGAQGLAMPMLARDMCQGITFAFQLAQGSREPS